MNVPCTTKLIICLRSLLFLAKGPSCAAPRILRLLFPFKKRLHPPEQHTGFTGILTRLIETVKGKALTLSTRHLFPPSLYSCLHSINTFISSHHPTYRTNADRCFLSPSNCIQRRCWTSSLIGII